MGVIYQAIDQDFNFLEAQVRELEAERNQGVLTSILGLLEVLDERQGEGKTLVFSQHQ